MKSKPMEDESEEQAPKKRSDPVDPVCLVAGLLFIVFGLATLAERDVDPVLLAGAGIAAIGVVMIAVVVRRRISSR